MPNIKSAEKRVKVIEKKTLENKAVKSKLATYTKKFKTAVASGDANVAESAHRELVSLLDKAVAENVIHANCAARRKASAAKLLATVKKA